MPIRPGPLLVILLLLAGCASSREEARRPLSPDATAGGIVVAVLGTPFYALFRATSCIVTTAIVVPSSAALALTDRPNGRDEREALQAGLGENCFGSYFLWPA